MLQNGVDVTVSALGKPWTFSRQRVTALDKFVAWVRSQLSDPVERLRTIIDKLPPDVALAELREAKKQAEELDYLDWLSPQVQRFLPFNQKNGTVHAAGAAHFTLLLLEKHHPEATLDDAVAILGDLSDEDKRRVFAETAGEPRGNGAAPVKRRGASTGIGSGAA